MSKGDFFEKVSSQVSNYDIIDFSYKASTSKLFEFPGANVPSLSRQQRPKLENRITTGQSFKEPVYLFIELLAID